MKKPVTPSVAEYVEDLRHTVTVASLNYDIWWTYKEKESRAKYIEVLNRYPLFFQPSIHAHFIAMLVALYRLYETRDDTFNIPNFLALLELCGSVPTSTVTALRQQIGAARPLWIKVSILRNKAFGHRALTHSVSDAFKEAKATPNDVKRLLELTRKLLNDATQAWNRSTHAFNLKGASDTIAMLDDLVKVPHMALTLRSTRMRRKRRAG